VVRVEAADAAEVALPAHAQRLADRDRARDHRELRPEVGVGEDRRERLRTVERAFEQRVGLDRALLRGGEGALEDVRRPALEQLLERGVAALALLAPEAGQA